MSHCVFIAADTPLPEVTPSQDDPLHIDLDTGTIFDGGADDNDCLLPFDEVDLYCEKKYGVSLELPQFTNRRAEQITAYIRTALRKAIQFVEKQKTMIASVTLRKHTAKAIQESAAKIVPENSIMVGTRVGIGKVAINAVPMSTSQDIVSLINIDDAKWDKKFLCKVILARNNVLLSQARGATIKGIKIDTLAKLEIPEIPLNEQRRIAAVLDKVSGLIAKRREQLDKLDELVKARFVEMFGDPVSNPHQYPISQLSEYIEFLTSGSRGWSQYFSDDGEYFITIKNVKNCSISLEDVQYIKPPDNAEAVRTKVKDGDLLISITADLGRTGVVTKEIADHGAYINQHLTCIRLNREKLNPLYVAYYMESPAGKMQFNAKNQAGVKAGLNFNAINSLKLVVPPLEKQGLFVEFVSQTNKSKLTIQQSLDKLEVLKKALMQQYFG